MSKIILSFFAAVLALTSSAAERERDFRNFSGVCHGDIQSGLLWERALGWDRFDLSWQNLEPEQGKWNQDKLIQFADRRILAAKKKNVGFLPIFDYTAPWAAGGIVPDQDFVFGQVRYTVKRQENGDYRMELFNRVSGKEIKFAERKIGAKRMSQRYLAAEHVKDWENYVRRCVATLRAEPYNVEYFQIWNEAHPTSSFWYADMDAYFERVHLPAAKIIRELGGKVVYGGWICGAPLGEFVAMMDKHDAWKTVDVLDIHYFPLAGMEYLHRELARRKLDHLGIWQTELGFSTDPNLIANLYPRMLHWGLTRNWDYPDKYKSFYFAFSSPDSPKAYGFRRSLLLGKELNRSGRVLDVMSEVLGGGRLELCPGVESVPKLKFELYERLSSMESFRIGNRIVSAVHLLANNNAQIFVDWNGGLDTLHVNYDNPLLTLRYPGLKPEHIEKIERISMYGTKRDLAGSWEADGDGVKLTTPIREEDGKEFEYVDMPEGALPQLFYVTVTLKK